MVRFYLQKMKERAEKMNTGPHLQNHHHQNKQGDEVHMTVPHQDRPKRVERVEVGAEYLPREGEEIKLQTRVTRRNVNHPQALYLLLREVAHLVSAAAQPLLKGRGNIRRNAIMEK